MKAIKFLIFAFALLFSSLAFGQTDERDSFVGTWVGSAPGFVWNKHYPDTEIKLTVTKAQDDDYALNLKFSHDTKVLSNPIDVNLILFLYKGTGKIMLEKTQRAQGNNMFIVEAECFLVSSTELKVHYIGHWMHDRGAGVLDCNLKKVD